MDFANEYYVRLYTRDTTTWKRLLFNGQTVLMHVLRKLDMAGVLDLEDMQPWEAAVLHCGVPEDIALDGMQRCLDRGVLLHRGHFLVAPKYREANEASKSDRQRQYESRGKRRATALEEIVTDGDEPSRAVTRCHAHESQNGTAPSQRVTKHHTRSHAVTLTNSGSGSDAVAASERLVTTSPSGNGSRSSVEGAQEPQPQPASQSDEGHGSSPDAGGPSPAENGVRHRATSEASPIASGSNGNGHTLVSAQDAAGVWQRVIEQCMPGAAHAFKHWRDDFAVIAAACNAQPGKRHDLALQVATEWFWLAPDGPIQAGRIARTAATPELFAKYIARDLDAALSWHTKRKHEQRREVIAE